MLYLVRNIINDYNSMRSPVVAGCDGTESFLTCSIPLKKANPIIINVNALKNIVIYTRAKYNANERRDGHFYVPFRSI